MPDFEILRATKDAQRWDATIEALPNDRRDIHFTSAYGRVQEILGGEAMMAVLSINAGFIAQVFMRRATPFGNYTDLHSVYGYGGPVSNIDGEYNLAMQGDKFADELQKWAADNGIVSEYTDLHPLLLGHQCRMLTSEEIKIIKPVAIIDLKKFSEKTVARRVRRALKKSSGIVSRFVDGAGHHIFAENYYAAMDRKGARERWHFSPEYFNAHYRELNADLFYITGAYGQRILMTIGKYETAYAHFLASDGGDLHRGLDERLYFDTATWMQNNGYKRLHLGGGMSGNPNDPLLMFKRGFSSDVYNLASYRRTFIPKIYDELTERKRALEIAHGHELKTNYFPRYRAEAA